MAELNQARTEVLEEVSFRAEAGQLVAVVGPSGAGKTTLTYLIPRLYDPTTGHILIDGHDLRDVTLSSLTAQIGMVTQRLTFSTTPYVSTCCTEEKTQLRLRSKLPPGPQISMTSSWVCHPGTRLSSANVVTA